MRVASSETTRPCECSSLEKLRLKFRPEDLRFLFIGESPPASGRFFYRADSGLYRAVRDAFQIVNPSINDENFLGAFQSAGCYLIDLCPDPVDRLDRKSRRDTCLASEGLLAQEIAQLQPRVMVSVLRSIEGNVARAASLARWSGPLIKLPYPGRWARHKETFLQDLVSALLGTVEGQRRDGAPASASL